jgi:hypothetical protein
VFSACTVALDVGDVFSEYPQSITLNTEGTFAYIGNYESSSAVIVCSVDAGTGNLSGCANTSQLINYGSLSFAVV